MYIISHYKRLKRDKFEAILFIFQTKNSRELLRIGINILHIIIIIKRINQIV